MLGHRKQIVDIISEMLDNPDSVGIFPTTKAFDELEALVRSAQLETLGWMYVCACVAADKGKDIRQIELPAILDEFNADMKET